MEKQLVTAKQNERLRNENRSLLIELEEAYKNMEEILLQSEREKEIAYNELENKFEALQDAYRELSQKENMLIHLEKLSSIGAFIAEIVHELKNPLMIISSAAEFALLTDISGKARSMMEKIPEQVKRMSGMLGRFKAMAYKENESFSCFDINTNLNEFLSTLRLITPKMVEIEAELTDAPLNIYGDKYQLIQIYLNLARNAFDAMEGGTDSKLQIRTKSAKSSYLKENPPEYHCQDKENWERILEAADTFAVIEFSDNGLGIAPENLEYLFDSFFTTKERGKGTGLGLAIATDIVKKHNANISVSSTPKQGTTFNILIPLAEYKDTLQEFAAVDQQLQI
jgi:signal transduction histidine kinase